MIASTLGAAAATVVLTLASASFAHAQPQSKTQQACINSLNKAGAKVAKAQSKENTTCLKAAGKGDEEDAQGCLTTDAKEKVSTAKSKTEVAASRDCPEAPDFGAAGHGTINAAAQGGELCIIEDVFGADLTAAVLTDEHGAQCQSRVLKTVEKLAATYMKGFQKCKKKFLKSGSIISETGLEACVDGAAADSKLGKAVDRVGTTFLKSCDGTPQATAFPGECASAPFSACIDEHVRCRFCLTADAMDSLTRDCDLFDNNTADASCDVTPPTPTTTTTTSTVPFLQRATRY